MLHGLLPSGARWVLATPEMSLASLMPEEEPAVAAAVPGRVAEFRAGRAASRAALANFGVGPTALPSAANGAPVWPPGFVGSITHCARLCLAAVARRTEFAALGIDAEPAEPLPQGVIDLVGTPAERTRLDTPLAGRVLFGIKEAFYKSWSAQGGRLLDFQEVEVVVEGDRFQARAVDGWQLGGRWAVRDGFVLATSWVSLDTVPLPPSGGGRVVGPAQ